MAGVRGGRRLSSADRLFGWTPYRLAFRGDEPWVDWCHLDLRRMVEPFFYETVVQAMREPFNLVFQQHTPIETLAELPPGLPVAGFIFHMSRCGSTLVSQALAAFESNIVVAEAVTLRFVLRALAVGRATPDQAARWLPLLVNAYAQPRFAYEQRVVVKFMAADVLDIALVRQAFPEVPWIFVTRDPAEILASQAASQGIDLARGQIPAPRLGLTEDALWQMDPQTYQAHALAAFTRAALDAYPGGKGLVVDHSELPLALGTKMLPHLGLRPSAGAVELMLSVARRHSKQPDVPFSPEQDPHRANASAYRSIVEPIVGPTMAALAALRAA